MRNPIQKIDLEKLLKVLPENTLATKLVKRIVSISCILQDIAYSQSSLDLLSDCMLGGIPLAAWCPAQDVSLAYRGFFISAVVSLSRAFDEGSRGRNNLAFREAAISRGLAAEFDEFDRFRNTEIAHYDRFTHGAGRRYSDDSVVLVTDSLGETYCTPVYLRWDVSVELAVKVKHLVDFSRAFAIEKMGEVQARFFSLLQENEQLRVAIEKNREAILFCDDQFWRPESVGKHKSFEPHGPIASIPWLDPRC